MISPTEIDQPEPKAMGAGDTLQRTEISASGKFLAGALLIGLTIFSAVFLIGHWPDRLPNPKDNKLGLYTYEWFHVRLTNITDTAKLIRTPTGVTAVETGRLPEPVSDSVQATALQQKTALDGRIGGAAAATSATSENRGDPSADEYELWRANKLIHINTLLLILVAVAGFLGNMIYLATSFTTFVGAERFKASWLLWYCVKPFTAAALAIAIYFVFRAGFLNMSDDAASINIYGVMTIAILAGLFTDRATAKLKELFDVLLRPKEERPDGLHDQPVISGVQAEPLEAGKPASITLLGSNLSAESVALIVEKQPIEITKSSAERLSASYTLPDEFRDRDSVTLLAISGMNRNVTSWNLKIRPTESPMSEPEGENAPGIENAITVAGDVVSGEPDVDDPQAVVKA